MVIQLYYKGGFNDEKESLKAASRGHYSRCYTIRSWWWWLSQDWVPDG